MNHGLKILERRGINVYSIKARSRARSGRREEGLWESLLAMTVVGTSQIFSAFNQDYRLWLAIGILVLYGLFRVCHGTLFCQAVL